MSFTLKRPDFDEAFTSHRKYYVPVGGPPQQQAAPAPVMMPGVDAQGQPVLDANGDPVMVAAPIQAAPAQPTTDNISMMVPVFEDGPLEHALYWRAHFEEIKLLKNLDAPACHANARVLLQGEAKSKWIDADAETRGNNAMTAARFRQTMTAFMAKCGATETATEELRRLLTTVRKPPYLTIQAFKQRISELNRYLRYLPGPLAAPLGEATLFQTYKHCVTQWQQQFVSSNARASITTITELIECCSELEKQESKSKPQRGTGRRAKSPSNESRKTRNGSKDKPKKGKKDAKKTDNKSDYDPEAYCSFHDANGHWTRDCNANAIQRHPRAYSSGTRQSLAQHNPGAPSHRIHYRPSTDPSASTVGYQLYGSHRPSGDTWTARIQPRHDITHDVSRQLGSYPSTPTGPEQSLHRLGKRLASSTRVPPQRSSTHPPRRRQPLPRQVSKANRRTVPYH